MEVIIQDDPEAVAKLAARVIRALISKRPNSVLGLATGSTMLPLYRELVRLHRQEGLDFGQVTTFNLDEYVGLPPDHPASYHHFMQEQFFSKVNVRPEAIHIPDGMARNIPAACSRYERKIDVVEGVDLQVLGIGRDGHIGFNEPSSSLSSRTRIKTLARQTLEDNQRHFQESGAIPRHVLTMGIGNIMESRKNMLLAFGEPKAEAIAQAVEGPVTAMVPASVLQFHPTTQFIIDRAAASKLRHRDYYEWVYAGKPEWQRIP